MVVRLVANSPTVALRIAVARNARGVRGFTARATGEVQEAGRTVA